MRSEEKLTWRPDFSWPGKRRSIKPDTSAQFLNERFIITLSSSQASRSSPSMSSSNSWPMSTPLIERMDQTASA